MEREEREGKRDGKVREMEGMGGLPTCLQMGPIVDPAVEEGGGGRRGRGLGPPVTSFFTFKNCILHAYSGHFEHQL